MQPAGRIDDHRTGASRAPRLHGIERYGPWVGPRLMRDHVDPRALTPEPQLLDGRGTIGVGGGQQRVAAFASEQVGQLANRRRLARAVDAHHEHDGRRSLEVQRARPPAHLPREVGLQVPQRVGGRTKVGTGRLAAQVGDHPFRGGHTGVGGDQRRFEIVPEHGIERGAAEDFLEVGDIALTARLEAFRKTFPESLALGGRRVIWIRRSVHQPGPARPGADEPTRCGRCRARRESRRRAPRPAPSSSGCA